MPYSPPSANQSTSETPYPRVTTKTNSTPHPKMGFQLNGVENVGTAVSSNDSSTIINRTRNYRPHGEYIALDSGEIYFVNTKGQIGRIKGSDIQLLEKARNYFSWGGSVPCNSEIEREEFYSSSLGDILDGAGTAKVLTRRCVYDDAPYKSFRPANPAECSPGDLIRPFKDDIVGFQTSENTCAIFKNGTCIYRGEFDGRRLPVEFNWKDWAYEGESRIPNLNGGGITRGQAFIPELDANGNIKWAMPKHSAVIVGGVLDADGNETTNLEHLPSPIPQLHKIPTWLIWRHWFYPHPFSIVKDGMYTHPYEHPGYIASNFIKYRSYIWVSCSCAEVCAETCYVVNYNDPYFIGMKGGTSRPKVADNAVASEEHLAVITSNCIDDGTAKGAARPACPPCIPDPNYVQPPCTLELPQYKTEVVCTFYDFPPETPFKSQIQGFAIGSVERNPYSAEVSGFTICTKQPLFSSCKESRYVGSGQLPRHFPLDWSLVSELGYDSETPLKKEWYINAPKSGNGDRLQWWQKYIESFFLYQSKPLSAFVVRIPTPHGGGTYPDYVEWEVAYPGNMALQVRQISGGSANNYVPPWLSFSRYEKIPTSIPGIYQPQDPYTFDILLESGAAPIIARLNFTPTGTSLGSEPSIKDLLSSREPIFTQFLLNWNKGIMSHPAGSGYFASAALKLRTAQRSAVVAAVNQIFKDTASLARPAPYLTDAAHLIQTEVQDFLNSVVSQAFSLTESSYQQVIAGTLSETEYQLHLSTQIFSGLSESSTPIKNAINGYINKALTDSTNGFLSAHNQAVKTFARNHFRPFPHTFDPYWTRTPFPDLSINDSVGTYTFVELFRIKLLDSLQADIVNYVSDWNTEHTSNTSVAAIESLINTWFNDTFIPILEWHVSEPQPQLASSISAKYLSTYSFIPDFPTIDIPFYFASVTIPSIIPLIQSPSYSVFTHIAGERLGQELIPQLLTRLEQTIKTGIAKSIAAQYTKSKLSNEHKKMIGIDSDYAESALNCSYEFFTSVLQSCYSNAVAQLS